MLGYYIHCTFLIHIRPLYSSHRDGIEWTYERKRRHHINGENTPADEPEVSETTIGILDLLNQAPYGAYAVDMSQTILSWNPSAERILGFKADQVIGRRCYEVLRNLPEEGSTPICIENCPSIRLAREGRIPPVVHVRMLCASGRRMQALSPQ